MFYCFFLLAFVTCESLFACALYVSIFFLCALLSVIHSFITHSVTFLLFLLFSFMCSVDFFYSVLVELIRLREKEKVNNNIIIKFETLAKIQKNSYTYSIHISILRRWINFHPHIYLSSTSNYRIRMDRMSLFNPLLFLLYNLLRQCYPRVVRS